MNPVSPVLNDPALELHMPSEQSTRQRTAQDTHPFPSWKHLSILLFLLLNQVDKFGKVSLFP